VLVANTRHRRTAIQNFAVRQRPPTPKGRLTSTAILPAPAGCYLNLSADERASRRCIVARRGAWQWAGGPPASSRGAGRPRTRGARQSQMRRASLPEIPAQSRRSAQAYATAPCGHFS
jgi:hypothetical protein